jgi:hypothetical protein
MRWAAHGVLIVVLTLLTQVGGAIYATALVLRKRVPLAGRPRAALAAAFVGLYAVLWFPISAAASLNGRVGLPCMESAEAPLRVATPFYCVLHRHYVSPELRDVTRNLARAVDQAHPGALMQTLDANFPFFDGFPMLPHLSHDDGEKVDVAFYYRDAGEGPYRRGQMRSPIGYWAFEQPRTDERQPCAGAKAALSFRWDQVWFQPLTRNNLELDAEMTRSALRWLKRQDEREGIGKIFIEPHLADRLGVSGGLVRFQGCRAARHDDHLHIQLR